MARRPSRSLTNAGGLPLCAPVSAAGLLQYFQVRPSSSERYISIQVGWRIAVTIDFGDRRTEAGIRALSSVAGSGPMKESIFQVFAPSVVRTQITWPCLPSDFAAVRNIVMSCLPLM